MTTQEPDPPAWLARILAQKRIEVAKLHESWDSDFTESRVPLRASASLLRGTGAPLRLVCEVKSKSPSAGELSRKLAPADRALAYAAGGASMVSVLVDETFFGGSWDDLERVRAALDGLRRDIPVLAKEFVLDEIQVSVALARGADCVLLIARIVTAERLASLVRYAAQKGLEALVEVANHDELEVALSTDAPMIGVNARDLDTLVIDRTRAARLLAAVPRDRVALHLSGVRTETDVTAVASGRADAALVGEVLMREDDPTPLLARLVTAGGE